MELVGFMERCRGPKGAKAHQIPAFRAVFVPFCLDSGSPAAISPPNPAREFSRAVCFCAIFEKIAAGIEPVTTDQKAGPERSEAGIEHEGLKRCSQSSKPAAGNTASFRMMCSR